MMATVEIPHADVHVTLWSVADQNLPHLRFRHHRIFAKAQWLKITEKISFNIASEASCDYILSVQKFIKNVKNW